MNIPQLRKKIIEAEFFVGKMIEQEQTFIGDKEPFDYYLSAFLNAAISARGGFHLRQDRAGNEAIKRWREGWERTLGPNDKQLYDFMRRDRVAEHHSPTGSSRNVGQEGVELGIGVHHLPRGQGTITIGGIPAPLGGISHPAAVLYRPSYTFTIAGAERKVTDACRDYLALLKRMVEQFEADHN